MNTPIQKYWMLVASKNHVQNAITENIAQACHGKAYPLKRMNIGDGIIYYSPKLKFDTKILCQEFTAIGHVSEAEVYAYDMGNGFIPFRRGIQYLKANSVAIRPLIDKLEFISDKKRWGYQFRFGGFQISKSDFQLIAREMSAI